MAKQDKSPLDGQHRLTAADADEPVEIDLKVSELLYDGWEKPSYQRRTLTAKVKRIAYGFRPAAFDRIGVNYRDGQPRVFDGLHRLFAYQLRGWETIPARVTYGNSEAWEAAQWRIANNKEFKANGTPAQQFAAALIEGEPTALRVQESLKYAGLRAPKDTKSYTELLKTVENYGGPVLDRTLESCAPIPPVYSEPIPQWLIAGVSYLFSKSARFEVAQMRKAMEKHYPQMRGESRGPGLSHGTGTVRWARLVQGAYNKGLITKKVEVV